MRTTWPWTACGSWARDRRHSPAPACWSPCHLRRWRKWTSCREGATLVSLLPPAWNVDVIARLRDRGVSAFSFDLMPRTSRAQAMDALSSQASLAGYQAVLVAAARLGRAFPVMMTAAGTVPPARVLVMGAGVAGLQAVATARRLGAAVSAYDVRPEAAEEVRSLGATFLDLPIAGPGRRGRLRRRTDRGVPGPPAGADRRDGRPLRRGDHHRRRARPARAPAAQHQHDRGHAAGLGDRRPRRGCRR